ncbi:unnamed protein product, partial [Effrenium voratum]
VKWMSWQELLDAEGQYQVPARQLAEYVVHDNEEAPGQPRGCFGFFLRDPLQFATPVPITRRHGSVNWVRLSLDVRAWVLSLYLSHKLVETQKRCQELQQQLDLQNQKPRPDDARERRRRNRTRNATGDRQHTEQCVDCPATKQNRSLWYEDKRGKLPGRRCLQCRRRRAASNNAAKRRKIAEALPAEAPDGPEDVD